MVHLKKTGFALLILTILVGLAWYTDKRQVAPSYSGTVVKKNHWNNYGYTVVVYHGATVVARTLTSINGRFSLTLPADIYDIYIYEGPLVLVAQTIRNPGTMFVRLPSTEPPFYPLETIGFFIAVVIFGLGLSAAVLKRNAQGLLFLLTAFCFALVNGIEWVQSVLALTQEPLAGTIFSLKHVGFVWFGILLFLLIVQLSGRHGFLWLILLGLMESFVLVSWVWLGSDPAFVSMWGIAYSVVRDFCVLQTFLLVAAAYVLAVRCGQRPLLRAGLLWFLVLFFVLVVIPVLLRHGTEFFTLQYNIAASLCGLILFLSVFSVLMTFSVRGIEQFVAGSLMYSIMSMMLLGVFAVTIVAFGYFVQYAENKWLQVYALLLVLVALLPFKDIVQKYLELRLLGDTRKFREALSVLAERLARAVTFDQLQGIIQRTFKSYFAVTAKIIRAHGRDGCAFPLSTDEPATLVISVPQEKVLSPAEMHALEKSCATIALAMNRVIAYEKQLRALMEIEQQARLASLGTLTAGLAHEIKNPLAVLQNIISVLPRMSKQKLVHEYVPLLQRQVSRMQALLHNMLQFARPEKLQLRRINLKPVVEKTVALFAATARKNGITILVDLRNVMIQGDERALEQVLLNICLNALDSMSAGGILRLVLRKDTLQIVDTGTGIAPAVQNHLFDPFFTTKPDGSGLGLAIAKRILDKHNATIAVSSQLKKGTTFTIKFKR